ESARASRSPRASVPPDCLRHASVTWRRPRSRGYGRSTYCRNAAGGLAWICSSSLSLSCTGAATWLGWLATRALVTSAAPLAVAWALLAKAEISATRTFAQAVSAAQTTVPAVGTRTVRSFQVRSGSPIRRDLQLEGDRSGATTPHSEGSM